MTDKAVTLGKLPVRLIAELDGVFVFQSKAFGESNDLLLAENQQQLQQLQKGQTSYGELNLGLHVDDDSKQVLINRMDLLSAINDQLSVKQSKDKQSSKQQSVIHSLHWVNQVHGKQVNDIDAVASSQTCNNKLDMCPMDADAIISQQNNVGLAIMTADCVPIVLYQPATGQIAAIHAGWQGLACGVIKATAERFDSNEPITAWIGACISQANYEVDCQVLNKLLAGCTDNELLDVTILNDFELLYSKPSNTEVQFNNSYESDNKINNDVLHKSIDKLSNYSTLSTDKIYSEKVKLNLPKLAAAQLENLAIVVANNTAIDCSYEDPSYYSYRRQTHLQQPATGRMALIIVRSC